MATTSAEYTAIRTAIESLTSGKQSVSVTLDGMTITYNSNQLPQLQERERELLRRLSIRNVRKRVRPDFT